MAKPSVEVLQAVADAKDVDPTDLEAVLFEVVDPQALDQLFADRSATEGSVRFAFAGYDVAITPAGDVTTVEMSEEG